MKKLTNKEVLGMVLEVLAVAEHDQKDVMVEVVEKMIEQIDKKTENKKPTKAQIENESIKAGLLVLLADKVDGMAIKDIQAENGYTEYSNQKLSALLNQLVKGEQLTKEVGKDRKTIFKALNVETVEAVVE